MLNQTQTRSPLHVAAWAALVATLGDLLLLYVANTQRPELGLPEIGRGWLWFGGAIGVVAIPVYALGYRSAAQLLAGASAPAARVFVVAGVIGALLGSVIHGLTTVYISADLDAGGPGVDPMAAVASWGSLLVTLWGLATLGVVVASAIFFWLVVRGTTRAPRAAALANPALVTLALSALALPTVLLRSFLAPAAPNIAHLVFFVVCARALRSNEPPS